jgi:hypothetical protein
MYKFEKLKQEIAAQEEIEKLLYLDAYIMRLLAKRVSEALVAMPALRRDEGRPSRARRRRTTVLPLSGDGRVSRLWTHFQWTDRNGFRPDA